MVPETTSTEQDAPEINLYAYKSSLTASEEKGGLIWREIIHPGKWYKTDTGVEVEVTPHIIQSAYKAFLAGLPKYISIPASSHNLHANGIIPPEDNRGFVKEMKLVGDALHAAFDITSPATKQAILDGSIADCSVYLQPDVVHPATGEKYDWVLRHVLLTNNPLVQDLGTFKAVPASNDDEHPVIIHTYTQHPRPHSHKRKGTDMSENIQKENLSKPDEIILTGEALSEFQKLSTLGMSADDLISLAAQREALLAEAAQLREKARRLEVTRILKALEGLEEHALVQGLPGYRHYPVVIAAVEQALKNAPSSLALSDEGGTDLDTLVLGIVNAIPEAGRIALADHSQPQQQKEQKPGEEAISDGMVDHFLDQIN